jgi:2-(1,2-epoxy-1,2-dihydrophenyl)acetyl-CoA isomerase
MSEEVVLYELVDGVGCVTLNRPDSLNALSRETLLRLREVAEAAAMDDAVRAVLITGAGRAFCAGGDVKMMMSGMTQAGETPQGAVLSGAADLHHAISAFTRMPKPVVCAANGAAAGAGVGLALSADILWAAESATFKLAYTAIGLSPDGGTTFALPRRVGPKLATELFMTNRSLSAQEALSVGLVTRVLPDDELLTEARKLAGKLAQGPTRSFAEVKALVSQSLRNGLETQLENERQGIARSVVTRDFMEGVMSFVEKRPPQFEGE